MNELINWMRETLDQSGPDMDRVELTEQGEVRIVCSIRSERVLTMARSLAAEGFKVTMRHGPCEVTGW